jgi:hypothetical protein
MKLNSVIAASLLSGLAALAAADTVELSNGKIIDGTFIGREGDTITFDVDGIGMSFNANDVKNISMGSAAATPAVATAPAKVSGPIEVPAGTQLTIRLNETLDTGKHATGHKFSAALEGALVSNGVTIAPQGSRVYGVVSESVKSRRAVGKAKMILTVTDININGQIVPVATSGINAQTQATGKSSAGKVVRGAAIGGLIGGSDDAKTGAKVGLGAAVLSGGNQVVIPAGTLLDFTLAQSLKQQ